MLSDAQKKEIELLAAEQLRRSWGVVKPRRLEAAIDDIRARFIEEGWFGKPLTEVSHEVQQRMAQHELYGHVDREAQEVAERGAVAAEVTLEPIRDEEWERNERAAELD
jgi:hypothetical protein